MLIGPNGEKEGILSFDEAYEKASKLSLDLVQVSSEDSDPDIPRLWIMVSLFLIGKKCFCIKSKEKGLQQRRLSLGHPQMLEIIKLN